MSRPGTAPVYRSRATLLAIAAWNARNRAARDEYEQHPIVTAAVCERCGRRSRPPRCARRDCPTTSPTTARSNP